MIYNVRNEAEYLDYVETMLCYRQEISFVLPKPFVGNRGNVHDNELELYAKVFDPDREKKHELDAPFDLLRAAHFEILDGRKNMELETHADADVHLRYYQWLQLLVTMTTAQQVEAEFDKVRATREKYVEQLYWVKVSRLLEREKEVFLKRLDKAHDRDFAIANEIKRWNTILIDETKPVTNYDILRKNRYWNVAQGIRLGRRSFTHSDSSHYTKVEAWLQFLDWLKELQTQEQPNADTSAPSQESKDGTEAENEPELTGTRETVVNVLDPFSDKFIGKEAFADAIDRLCLYFDGEQQVKTTPIKVKKGQWKKVGKALGDIHGDIHNLKAIDHDYLKFAKETFDCYAHHDISNERLQDNTLYKYMKENG